MLSASGVFSSYSIRNICDCNLKLVAKIALIGTGGVLWLTAIGASGICLPHIGYFSFIIGGSFGLLGTPFIIAGIIFIAIEYCKREKAVSKEISFRPLIQSSLARNTLHFLKERVICLKIDSLSEEENVSFTQIADYFWELTKDLGRLNLSVEENTDIQSIGSVEAPNYCDRHIKMEISSTYGLKTPTSVDVQVLKYESRNQEIILFSASEREGVGDASSRAAYDANCGFIQYLQKIFMSLTSYGDLVYHMCRAVDNAGSFILAKAAKRGYDSHGISSHLGVFIFKLEEGYRCLASCLGDLKLFVLRENGECEQITARRTDISNKERLGIDHPDLKHFSIYIFECHKGDILLSMSNGVYKNLVPMISQDWSKKPGGDYLNLIRRIEHAKGDCKALVDTAREEGYVQDHLLCANIIF